MDQLDSVVRQNIEWMESQDDLEDYGLHASNLESNLHSHAQRMLSLRQRVIAQITLKCGIVGREVYGQTLNRIAKVIMTALFGMLLGGLVGAGAIFVCGLVGLESLGRIPQLACVALASVWISTKLFND